MKNALLLLTLLIGWHYAIRAQQTGLPAFNSNQPSAQVSGDHGPSANQSSTSDETNTANYMSSQSPHALQGQTVRGIVMDKASESPLAGATVMVLDVEPAIGALTNENGLFELKDVPVGRQAIRITFLGYDPVTLPNILVTSGKEVILEVGLEEKITELEEVVITGETSKDNAQNELATVSARTFSLEEVTRYSGARNDVARMASNYAGVSTADDSRNDIVIRGNSPIGVLWRLEGIPIPNPNHFATLGTTGGPVSAMNTNMLKNSDFLTGAFPSEYGNANAGVFDVGFRSGNKDSYEFTAQLGAFSGLEAMAEGPISKKNRSSFLVAYRYSFVGLIQQTGLAPLTNATPQYQDLSFKLDLGYGKAGRFTLFGLGGTSSIDFLASEVDSTDLFAEEGEDAYPRSKLGMVGLKHQIATGKNGYIRTVLGAATTRLEYTEDNYLDNGDKLRVTENNDIENRYTFSSFINQKFSSRFTARAGVLAEYYDLELFTRDRVNRPDLNGDGEPDWATLRDFRGGSSVLQAYAQGQYRLNEALTLNLGLHGQYLTLNQTSAIEPRAALNWQFLPQHKLSVAYGLHSQIQPLVVYFFTEEVEQGVFRETNEDLKFTRSQHFVLGYDFKPADSWRVKAEAYYQLLDNIPVDAFSSTFSLINAGADFVFPQRGSLVNEGTGRNYGIEVTVEKFFSNGWYGLVTGSVYDSKYTASDNVERNTAFNNRYVMNVLGGKEFKLGKSGRNALTFDSKLAFAGGRFYTPVDLETSLLVGEEVKDETQAFTLQHPGYFRWDVKFGYRLNSKSKKLSQQFYIDLQNVTNQQNVFVQRFNKSSGTVNTVYQQGFFPDILYRIQF